MALSAGRFSREIWFGVGRYPERTLRPGARYRAGLEIRQTLARRDPGNTRWHRNLSVSHDRIGDVLVAQGEREQALAAYRTGLGISQTLARRDPANTQWQRDLISRFPRTTYRGHAHPFSERSTLPVRSRLRADSLRSTPVCRQSSLAVLPYWELALPL